MFVSFCCVCVGLFLLISFAFKCVFVCLAYICFCFVFVIDSFVLGLLWGCVYLFVKCVDLVVFCFGYIVLSFGFVLFLFPLCVCLVYGICTVFTYYLFCICMEFCIVFHYV